MSANYEAEQARIKTRGTELTAEVIREFVEMVIVFKAETVDGVNAQPLKIVWSCTGKFVPQIASEIEKSA